MDDASYEKSNREMRAKHKREKGTTLGKRLTKGKTNVESLLLVGLQV